MINFKFFEIIVSDRESLDQGVGRLIFLTCKPGKNLLPSITQSQLEIVKVQIYKSIKSLTFNIIPHLELKLKQKRQKIFEVRTEAGSAGRCRQ